MTRIVLALAALLTFAGPAAAALWTVTLEDDAALNSFFNPAAITINRNDTVRWELQSIFPHTVTADPGQTETWTEAILQVPLNLTFQHTFTNVGTFRYYCRFHGGPGGQGMSGTVTVLPEPTGTAALGFLLAGLGALRLRLRR